MKPHKSKKLLETNHKDVSAKHWDFFVRKFNSFRSAHKVSQKGKFTTKRSFSFISSLIQDCSMQKACTTGESLVLPAAIDMVLMMIGEKKQKR